jgi:hypothetical protein
MVSGERCAVQHYSGQTGDEVWNVRVYENLTDAVILESRGCRLTLAEIYATVEPHSTGQELYPAE